MYMAIAEEGSSSMEHKTATISLANFKAKHLELELEDDRFTDYLKVKKVPMLTKISLAHFKAKYPELELEDDLFTDYLKDQNGPMLTKVSFDDSINPHSHPGT
ncbi:hypothetical protein B296_00031238 [Ensete ventricosum]|uniref:Uncharacterized protein n=1 Tax=Ensete ventricosum TaxID=4639 RepID=A0A426YJN0_ENSVE|nr:hypothetical protein B296_00031238 [Ensete ventricosum]